MQKDSRRGQQRITFCRKIASPVPCCGASKTCQPSAGGGPPATGAKVSQAKSQVDVDLLSINTIRTLAIDAVQQANSGHPGAPMGLAPVVYELWQKYLRYDRGSHLAEPRPFRAFGGTRFDAAVRHTASGV